MPTRKQRRRREKELRHEYELVWEDAEGKELPPEDAPSNGPGKRASARPAPRAGRQVQPPSWRRTFRRSAIFAPVMFATVFILSPHLSTVQKITQTLIIVAIFIPFSHLLDGILYRGQQKRAARSQATGKRG
ncbi:MAG TPA: hypothetical protein VFK76_12010 [Gaiellaceae bacterium]|nr:hypothetical protein [Gaiellaceae bacterium]